MEIILEPIIGFIFGNFFVMVFDIALTVALLHPKFNLSLILYDRLIRIYILKEENKNQNTTNVIPHKVQ